jgi:hypothetical protein
MHVVVAEPLPEDLLAFFKPARFGIERVDALADPTAELTELAAAAAAVAPAERARRDAAWRDLAQYDATTGRRLRMLVALAGLRSFAGDPAVRLWDPRLETTCAMAEAALARWRAAGVSTDGDARTGELTQVETAALQQAHALLAEAGAIQQASFLDGMALWQAEQLVTAAARHFRQRAAASRDAAMVVRQQLLAERLEQTARQVDETLYGRKQ